MATKPEFGQKQSRLVSLWTSEGFGEKATYKDVATQYKKLYPKDEQPSDQTIGNARKKAFNLPTVKRSTTDAGPSLDQLAAVLTVLIEHGDKAADVRSAIGQIPVNPFQALDDAAGGRSNLIVLLDKLATAQSAVEMTRKTV